jgi:Fur family ferric uptake transcriptional regulator
MPRTTRQRTAIHNAFETAGRPLSPVEVLEAASAEVPSLGQATVYRALRAMVEEGVLAPVELPGEPDRYELADAAAHHHHHFRCDSCDRVFDVHGCPGGLSNLLPPGFTMRDHEIVLFGRCDACAS